MKFLKQVNGVLTAERMNNMTGIEVYKRNGYANRKEYLETLASEFELPYGTVKIIADMLGADEDFDGLVTELEEMYDYL